MIDSWKEQLGNTLYLLLGAVASLLLIGCGNVSILLLARGIERRHEFAVRAAVGAGRSRILRQLFTESLVIAVAGSAISLFIAWRGTALLINFLPEFSVPQESVVGINIPVLLFSIALAFAAAILSGLWPALQVSRHDISKLLQGGLRRMSGDKRGRRTHNTMIAAQVALTVLLLAAAGAAAKGFLRVLHVDLGYDPQRVLMVVIPLHGESHTSWQERSEYIDQLRASIAALPEVEDATVSSNATPPSNGNDVHINFFGRPDLGSPEIRMNFVGPEYFSLLRIPLVQGRMWDHVETMRAAPFAVINQTMARQYWPNGDAIGREFRTPDFDQQTPASRSAQCSRLVASHRRGRRFAQRWLTRSDSTGDLCSILDPHLVFHAHPRQNSRSPALDRARRAQANRKSRRWSAARLGPRSHPTNSNPARIRQPALHRHIVRNLLRSRSRSRRSRPLQRRRLLRRHPHQRIRRPPHTRRHRARHRAPRSLRHNYNRCHRPSSPA